MSRRLRPTRVPIRHVGRPIGILRPEPGQTPTPNPADLLGPSLNKAVARFNDGAVQFVETARRALDAATARTAVTQPPVNYLALMASRRTTRHAPATTGTMTPGVGPVAAQPPTLPVGVRMVEPPTNWRPYTGERAIILCGLIPGVDPWHDQAAGLVARRYAERVPATEHPLTILCPRRRDIVRQADGTVTVDGDPWTAEDQAAQVGWEARHVRRPRAVALFWFPASTPEYVGPTSLLELGAAWGQGMPVVVGAHPSYTRHDILEHQLPNMDLDLHGTIQATVDAALNLLDTHRATSIYRGRPGLRPLSRPSEIDPGSQPAARPTE